MIQLSRSAIRRRHPRLGEKFQFGDLQCERYDVEGQLVSVATRMKRDTVRPVDHADAKRLADAFNLEEDS